MTALGDRKSAAHEDGREARYPGWPGRAPYGDDCRKIVTEKTFKERRIRGSAHEAGRILSTSSTNDARGLLLGEQAVLLDKGGQAERMIAHEPLGKIGVARGQSVYDRPVLLDRPRSADVGAEGHGADGAQVDE